VNGPLERGRAEALVKGLAGLMKAQALYPAGHVAVVKARGGLSDALRDVFPEDAPLLVGAAEGYLVVGGVAFFDALPQAGELFRALERREVEGVILEPEVAAEEVARFCAWLRSEEAVPWEGRELSLTQLRRSGSGWERAVRVHRVAVEAVEKAYRELQEGRIPAPAAAIGCVREFSELLAENPTLLKGLVLIKDYDRYTFHHSVNVSLLSLLLAGQQGLCREDQEWVGVAGLFHDIGKTRTPAEVVRKPGRLTTAEWSVMLRHPEHGRDIVLEMGGFPHQVAQMVYEHHMRHDGGGYPTRPPQHCLAPQTPLITLADVYDAMTTHRTYSPPLPLPEAVEALENLRETHLPAWALDGFLEMMGPIPVGSVVRLGSGEVAVVSRLDDARNPVAVRIAMDPNGQRLPAGETHSREVGPGEVVSWVNPLVHGIDPVEVLRPDL
jgi:putative nucleotidyltransferase with HDIG domain